MLESSRNLEEFLGNVLRGVNKIVGCNSTNLVVISERAKQMRVSIGATADSYPELAALEKAMGRSFRSLTVPVENAADSFIGQVWRDGLMRETSSLSEMVGSAIPEDILDLFERQAGERRFMVAPATGSHRRYGVLIFEKPGLNPFTVQQREVLLRYARRIGDILENDMMGQGLYFGTASQRHCDYLMLDSNGDLIAWSENTRDLANEVKNEIGKTVADWLKSGKTNDSRTPQTDVLEEVLFNGMSARCSVLELNGSPVAVCRIQRNTNPTAESLENQLLQLTVGEPSPVLFLDMDFLVTSANAAAEKLFDLSQEVLLGYRVSELFLEPTDLEDILGRYSINPVGGTSEIRAVARNDNGSLHSVNIDVLVLADDRDRNIGFLLMLRAGADALDDHSLGALLDRERMASMGEMAAQLAHEIRNPIVAIGATLDNLSKGDVNDSQRTMLGAALQEIHRLDMILRKHLSSRSGVVLGDVVLYDLLGHVKRLLDGTRKKQGKTIKLEMDRDLSVRGDHDGLEHVFFNLVLNALEASSDGGEVKVWTRVRNDTIEVIVDDRGCGLEVSAKQCIQPFFTTKANGTGLGLAVCAKIVQAHGGTLDLSNRDGGGCRARVVLPGPVGNVE